MPAAMQDPVARLAAASEDAAALPVWYFTSRPLSERDVDYDSGQLRRPLPAREASAAHARRGAVAVAARTLIDDCFDDLANCLDGAGGIAPDALENTVLGRWFPPRLRAGYDEHLLRRVTVTFARLADALAAVSWRIPSCTAEELCTNAIAELAAQLVEAAGLPPAALPAQERLLDDLDFEMLFDQGLDGIENDPALLSSLAVAPMDLADWFVPFNSDRCVHPYCRATAEDDRVIDLLAAGFDPQAPESAGPIADDACAPISATVELARAATGTSSIGAKSWIPRGDDAAQSLAEARTYLAGRERNLVLLQWQAVLRDDESIRAENVRLFRVHDHFPGAQDCPWLEIGWNNRHMGIPVAAVVSVCHLDV